MRRCEKQNKEVFLIDGRFKFFGSWLVPFGDVRSSFMVNLYQVCKAFVKKYEHEFSKECNKKVVSTEMSQVFLLRKDIQAYQNLGKKHGLEDVYAHSIENRIKKVKRLLKQHFENHSNHA